jgi:hypothetical protein
MAGGFRILAIVDDFTRECLALVADTRYARATSGVTLEPRKQRLQSSNPPTTFS